MLRKTNPVARPLCIKSKMDETADEIVPAASSDVRYQKLSQIEHILHRPDLYVGNVRPVTFEGMHVFRGGQIRKVDQVTVPPGLVQIFTEILSNAVDNVQRSKEQGTPATFIRVNFTESQISVENDGYIIPVDKFQGTDRWIPDMIFGELHTSSNYDDTQDRRTSGRNGMGANLTNVFSTRFDVVVQDPVKRKQFHGTWRDNMQSEPQTKVKSFANKKGKVAIAFTPDIAKFGLAELTDDVRDLMAKMVYDAAMLTGVRVSLNDQVFKIKTLKEYACLYYNTPELIFAHTADSDAVLCSGPGVGGDVVAFTNGVPNREGGVHVNVWFEAFLRPLVDKINRKTGSKLTIAAIKPYVSLFVSSTLVNPSFDSQDKRRLNSPTPVTPRLPDLTGRLAKWGFMRQLTESISQNEDKEVKKLERKRPMVIENFDAANNAGKRHMASQCTLILSEGISAKNYVTKGITKGWCGKAGRDWFGNMPLKGKAINPRKFRGKNMGKTISKNVELRNIIQILGLHQGADYRDDREFQNLNYGKLMMVCDADSDGIHIQGLILNILHYYFPSVLLRTEPFVYNMRTPITKVTIGRRVRYFYDLRESTAFLERTAKKPRVEYLKGLGSSEDADIQASFGVQVVAMVGDDRMEDNMNKAFAADQTDARKQWLLCYDESETHAHKNEQTISDMINHDLIQFSIYNCHRNLPNLFDGFKPSQRKALFGTLKKNSSDPIKVYQLTGYVTEHAHYHHGDMSMNNTIISMAQKFTGTNNLPLLQDRGQFGSRLCKEASAPRYISTQLSELTKLIFRPEDDCILESAFEDGAAAEPIHYMPILPMVLVNGANGIATGWNTKVASHNPLHLIGWLRAFLADEERPELVPWFRGFRGTTDVELDRFVFKGIFTVNEGHVVITEVPPNCWFDKYLEFLKALQDAGKIANLIDRKTTDTPYFEFDAQGDFEPTFSSLELFSSTKRTGNAVLIADGQISRYDSAEEILGRFCDRRLQLYDARKEKQLEKLHADVQNKTNRIRFMQDVMNRSINIFGRDEGELEEELREKAFVEQDGSFSYLLDINLRSFSEKRLAALRNEHLLLEETLAALRGKTNRALWLEELEEFEGAYREMYAVE